MKKLNISDPIEFGLDDLTYREKMLLKEFKKLDLDEVKLENVVSSFKVPNGYGTTFHFSMGEGIFLYFIYESNEKIIDVYIENNTEEISNYGEMNSLIRKNRQSLIDFLWEQIAQHFNLKLRLTFVSRTNPWTFGK